MVGLVALCVVWIRPLIHKNTGILHCVQDDDNARGPIADDYSVPIADNDSVPIDDNDRVRDG